MTRARPGVLEAAWRFRDLVLICIGVCAVLGLFYGLLTANDASATAARPSRPDRSRPVVPGQAGEWRVSTRAGSDLDLPLLVLGTANYDSPVRSGDLAAVDDQIRIVGHVDDRDEFLDLLLRMPACDEDG